MPWAAMKQHLLRNQFLYSGTVYDPEAVVVVRSLGELSRTNIARQSNF
jgi:hypothetical protein